MDKIQPEKLEFQRRPKKCKHKWDANLKTSHLKTIFSHLQSLSSLNLKNILMTSAWWFIKINLSPPASLYLIITSNHSACFDRVFTEFSAQVTKSNCADPPPLPSSQSPLIRRPHVCTHTKNPQTISFFCQLHMRWCHCLHPLSVARKYFPISFMCHCSFPSTAGCLSQLENWFIMLSSPELGEGWGRNNVDRVSGNRCWFSQQCGNNEYLYAIGQIWLGQFSSPAVLDLREERFRAVIGFGITMATTE